MRYAVWGHETGAARERRSERAEAARRSRVSSGQGAAARNGSQRGQASNGPTRVAREEQQAGAESDGAWRREVCGRGDGEVVEVISWSAGSQRTDGGASGGRPSINHRPSAMSTIIHASCQGQAGAAAVEWPAAVPCRAFWANYCSELLIINSTSPASAASIKPPLTRDKLLEHILISSAPPRQPPPSRYLESHTPRSTRDTRHLLCFAHMQLSLTYLVVHCLANARRHSSYPMHHCRAVYHDYN
jgi:hypothetical protein